MKITINYTDGHTDEAKPTLRETLQGETYLRRNRLGTPQDSQMTFSAYVAYAVAKRAGTTGKTFEDWQGDVESIEFDNEDNDPLRGNGAATEKQA